MEDALKARLIGATVLVALAVLLVPELLSGRKPAEAVTSQAEPGRGTRTFTIELGGAAGGPVVTQAPRSPAPATAPLPSPESGAAPVDGEANPTVAGPAPVGSNEQEVSEPQASPASTPPASTPPVAAPESRREAVASSAPEPASTPVIPARGGWAVQVGAFGSADAANKLVRQLQSADFAAYVAPVSRSGKTLHRVRVGPVTERAGAEALVPALKARGLPATVVAND
jgi:cell division septation protein DedD